MNYTVNLVPLLGSKAKILKIAFNSSFKCFTDFVKYSSHFVKTKTKET